MDPAELLPVVIPLIVLQLALIVFALRDLVAPDRRVRGDSKLLWAGAIILLDFIGPIVYFLYGRRED